MIKIVLWGDDKAKATYIDAVIKEYSAQSNQIPLQYRFFNNGAFVDIVKVVIEDNGVEIWDFLGKETTLATEHLNEATAIILFRKTESAFSDGIDEVDYHSQLGELVKTKQVYTYNESNPAFSHLLSIVNLILLLQDQQPLTPVIQQIKPVKAEERKIVLKEEEKEEQITVPEEEHKEPKAQSKKNAFRSFLDKMHHLKKTQDQKAEAEEKEFVIMPSSNRSIN